MTTTTPGEEFAEFVRAQLDPTAAAQEAADVEAAQGPRPPRPDPSQRSSGWPSDVERTC